MYQIKPNLILFIFLLGFPIMGEASGLLDWPGVYKYSKKNGNIDGDRYNTEDIMEIVELEKDKYYFRIKLSFFNGHGCDISGMAHPEGESLIYRSKSKNQCVLSIRKKNDSFVFRDLGEHCQFMTCGARGFYGDGEIPSSFKFSMKKKIRYLPVIKNSSQFLAAEKEYLQKN